MSRFTGFISYSHKVKAWVESFHATLERALAHHGRPDKVFLDDLDIGPNRSWVGRLQAGLDQAEKLLLVVTPEALASPRVTQEWEAFIAMHPDALRRLVPLLLIDAPLPAFWQAPQWVDFRDHDDAKFRRGMQEVLAALFDHEDKRNLPALPEPIDPPRAPRSSLPAKLRTKLVEWMVPCLEKQMRRRGLADALCGKGTALEDQPSLQCAASTALVVHTAGEDPLVGAIGAVDILLRGLSDEEQNFPLDELRSLRQQLEDARPTGAATDGPLADWLQSVANDHARIIPYFDKRADSVLLEQVFVTVELKGGMRMSTLAGEAAKALDAPLQLETLLQFDPTNHPWITRRWIVLGDPGAGKTTLLRHLTRTLATAAEPRWYPIFESLPRFLRDDADLLTKIERRMRWSSPTCAGLKGRLERLGEDGKLLFLLDGLDEVDPDKREEAHRLLRDLATAWPNATIVVSSRSVGFVSPDDSRFRELQLQPLERERRLEFLQRRFAASAKPPRLSAEAALKQLEKEESSRKLAGNPLHLMLIAYLLTNDIDPSSNRPKLYEQMFDLLLDGKHRTDTAAKPFDNKLAAWQALRYLAFAMTEANRDAEPLEQIENRLYEEEAASIRAPLENLHRWKDNMKGFLHEIADRTSILAPHDGSDYDWRFWHRTFREALAAEYLVEIDKQAGGRTRLLELAGQVKGNEARWAEPFALVVGQVDAPDALVKALMEQNTALGIRALATAQGLRDETFVALLGLTKDWNERKEIYQRVVPLFEDGKDLERGLQLFVRIAESLRRREAEDLYWLDESLRGVAAYGGRPEIAEPALVRLYALWPDPPEDLFERIETPIDGVVDLWRSIEAGSFMMGSPEGVGDFDERPPHRVTISRGFQMAVIPVTVAQYRAFDHEHDAQGDHTDPVTGVSWYAVIAFCCWLGRKLPGCAGARLPTEAEWEYACRAGTSSKYWSGESERDLARVGWYQANSGRRLHRVGEKAANDWGLYDMHGNVWEWVGDLGKRTYSASAVTDPMAESGVRRVVRGGSFADSASRARSAYRYGGVAWFRAGVIGFRVVRPAPSES